MSLWKTDEIIGRCLNSTTLPINLFLIFVTVARSIIQWDSSDVRDSESWKDKC